MLSQHSDINGEFYLRVVTTHRPYANGVCVYSQILGYAGYLQSVLALTCNRKGKIRPTGKLETVTKMKVIKWMNH
ncbi:hypothetical protein DUI87_27614 [Hirundo rustica rustica]|uniref:Uncharacterized protein n=1 Tax=Hirundo rustica rustica TaxID=333673 RepID=A0A3M0J3W4_HIRRU|nr:hypothetical protein DUI87_27614 [Hirundo rustica rustica]